LDAATMERNDKSVGKKLHHRTLHPIRRETNIVRRFLYILFSFFCVDSPILHIENVIAFIVFFFVLSILLCAFALISYHRLQ
jgi:hypothetical protein